MSDPITDKAVTAAPAPYAEPDVWTDWIGEDGETPLRSAGWDLSFGCRLNIGPDEDGSWRASVSMSDQPARVGHCIRTVTPEQVATHAANLITVLRESGHGGLLETALPHLADQPATATAGQPTPRWTSHGWWIGDGPEPVEDRPSRRARCGGLSKCETCKREAAERPHTASDLVSDETWIEITGAVGWDESAEHWDKLRTAVEIAVRRQSADRDTETAALRTALDEVTHLHREFRIYDECGHRHTEGDPGTKYVNDVGLVCEDGYQKSICREECADGDEYQSEECAANHEGLCWSCPTHRAASLRGGE